MEKHNPGAFNCSDGSPSYGAISPALRYLPVYAALISSSLSLMGAALSIIAYCAFKDLRKLTAQTIIMVLAVADFVLALSCFFGAFLHLIYGTTTNTNHNLLSDKNCDNFGTLCQIQAFVGLWMLGSSFTWTSVLALHFFLVTICTRSTWPHRLMPLYNITAWLIPLFYTLPILVLGKLDYDPLFTWSCFMRWPTKRNYLIQWDILEMTTAACLFLCYTCVLFSVFLKSRRQSNTARKVSKRLLAFLVVFLLLRTWAMAAIVTHFSTNNALSCSSRHIQTAGFIFDTLTAVADPGQGWANCILYIFLSPELRKRMFVQPFQRVWKRLNKRTRQKLQRELVTSPLLEDNTNPLLAPARGQGDTTDGRTHTYLSFSTEFPCSDQENFITH